MAAGRHVVVVGASGNVGTSVLDALDADPSEAELPGGRVEELKTGVGSRP